MPQERSTVAVVIAAVVVLAIAGTAFYYYWAQWGKDMATQQSQKQLQDARSIYRSGDYTTSINVLSKIVDNAPNASILGQSKINIAANLYARNVGDDRAHSVRIYKEVTNGPSMPPYVRALALNSLANIVKDNNEAFYTSNFSDSPFNSYLSSSGTSRSKLFEAYKKILERSNETYPTSYAEYAIAGNYYAPLLADGISLGTTTPERAAEIMQNYVKEADARHDDTMYGPNIVLRRYLYRALAIDASSKILKKNNLEERENAYKLILDKGILYKQESDSRVRMEIMRGRLFYADFILKNFGKERHSDIVNILKQFPDASSASDPSFSATRSYFANLKNASSTSFARSKVLPLVKISPEFKTFLISIGWTEKDLAK